jgi:hypothetical protein
MWKIKKGVASRVCSYNETWDLERQKHVGMVSNKEGSTGSGMVAHICNPCYLGDGDRIAVQGQPRQKQEILSEKQN